MIEIVEDSRTKASSKTEDSLQRYYEERKSYKYYENIFLNFLNKMQRRKIHPQEPYVAHKRTAQ